MVIFWVVIAIVWGRLGFQVDNLELEAPTDTWSSGQMRRHRSFDLFELGELDEGSSDAWGLEAG